MGPFAHTALRKWSSSVWIVVLVPCCLAGGVLKYVGSTAVGDMPGFEETTVTFLPSGVLLNASTSMDGVVVQKKAQSERLVTTYCVVVVPNDWTGCGAKRPLPKKGAFPLVPVLCSKSDF